MRSCHRHVLYTETKRCLYWPARAAHLRSVYYARSMLHPVLTDYCTCCGSDVVFSRPTVARLVDYPWRYHHFARYISGLIPKHHGYYDSTMLCVLRLLTPHPSFHEQMALLSGPRRALKGVWRTQILTQNPHATRSEPHSRVSKYIRLTNILVRVNTPPSRLQNRQGSCLPRGQLM